MWPHRLIPATRPSSSLPCGFWIAMVEFVSSCCFVFAVASGEVASPYGTVTTADLAHSIG